MLIDAHVHLDKYGDLLDEALREIDENRIFTVATAMDVPSYLELQKSVSARISCCRLSASIPGAPRSTPINCATSAATSK